MPKPSRFKFPPNGQQDLTGIATPLTRALPQDNLTRGGGILVDRWPRRYILLMEVKRRGKGGERGFAGAADPRMVSALHAVEFNRGSLARGITMNRNTGRVFSGFFTAFCLTWSVASSPEPAKSYKNPETGEDCVKYTGTTVGSSETLHVNFKNSCGRSFTIRYKAASQVKWSAEFILANATGYGVIDKKDGGDFDWYVDD